MAHRGKLVYRPEIDGLRAVAVLTIVLYHAGICFAGGFIGVDVFFVISGFLVTSLIWRDLEAGNFSFTDFWVRRARRIVPALVVVTVATLIAGCFLLLPQDLENLGQAASSQAILGANFHYCGDFGYFTSMAEEKPLLHTWSLAVEEQFYLLAPLLLWALVRFTRDGDRKTAINVLVVVGFSSLAMSVYGVALSSEIGRGEGRATYYLLHTRAWELLLGSLLALLPIATWLTRRPLREFLSAAGLLLILAPALLYTRATPFPGWAAVPPCLGTALIIWCHGAGTTMIGRLLSIRPLVFVGLISYSLYLWHWPLLAFGKYRSLAPLEWGYSLFLVMVSFAIAVLSWKFIETPFRLRQLATSRRAVFAWTGWGTGTIIAASLLFMVTKGIPQRLSPAARAIAEASADMSYIHELSTADIRAGRLVSIGDRSSGLRPQALVWGDSHAMAALAAFDAFFQERGIAAQAATHSSTVPVKDWYSETRWGLGKHSLAYNEAVLAHVHEQKISDVFLVAAWHGYTAHENFDRLAFNAALLATARELVDNGARPWILLTAPFHSFDVPRALAQPLSSRDHVHSRCKTPSQQAGLGPMNSETLKQIEALGGRVIDPRPRFLDPTGKRYVVEINGQTLYRDGFHLSATGARLTLLPLLRDEVNHQLAPHRGGMRWSQRAVRERE